MDDKTGGAAFPCYKQVPMPSGVMVTQMDGGMTLRDYFAAKAMQAMAAKGGYEKWIYISQDAYELADAMLEARK